jgi:hypothetical protein
MNFNLIKWVPLIFFVKSSNSLANLMYLATISGSHANGMQGAEQWTRSMRTLAVCKQIRMKGAELRTENTRTVA